MVISEKGVLSYVGHSGTLYEIIGFKNGIINLRKI